MTLPYRYVIGLEVHVELSTATKMFCRCKNEPFGAEPNIYTCPVCFGLPGALPVPNMEAVRRTVMTGLALGANIPARTRFDRKHYYYPDLPKGYQISQYKEPLAVGGQIEVPGTEDEPVTIIHLERVHLEEDAGKLLHSEEEGFSFVDLNRAGVPLMEMVSCPELTSPTQARRFLKELQLLVRAIGVSEADMEKGQMRCDVNLSLQFEHEGEEVWTPITEIKNVNSTRAVERGLIVEAKRLYEEWVANGPIRTRKNKLTAGWDEKTETVKIQRTKEEANDYRYFPEPDIPNFSVYTLEQTTPETMHLPELPAAIRMRYTQLGLSSADTEFFVQDERTRNRFDEIIKSNVTPKIVANLLMNAPGSEQLDNQSLRTLTQMVEKGEVPFALLRPAIPEIIAAIADKSSIEAALESLGLVQRHDATAVTKTIKEVLAANPLPVNQYRAGEQKVLGFLVGQVMKRLPGKATAATVSQELVAALQAEQ